MVEVASINQVVQIGIEVAEGTAVPADKILNSVSIELSPDVTVNAYTATGRKFPTVASLGKEFSGGSLTGSPSYPELPFLFAAVMGNLVTAALGGSPAAYSHKFHPKTSGTDIVKSLTIERGDQYTGAHRAAGVKITELSMAINREEVTMGGALLGKAIEAGRQLSGNATQRLTMSVAGGAATGGTFTLTAAGGTTAPIAYNASADAVRSALAAVSGIGSDNVAVSGNNGGPWTIVWVGALAGTNPAALTSSAALVTGPGAPYTLASVVTTATGAPTELDQVPVQPTEWTAYLDDTQATLGTTKLTRLISAGWSLGDRFSPVWVVDASETSYVATVELQPTTELTLMMQANPQAMAMFTVLRAGALKWLRLQAVGPVISGANRHKLTLDQPIRITDIGDFADDAGVFAVDFTAQMFHDAGWGKACEVEVVTTLAAVA